MCIRDRGEAGHVAVPVTRGEGVPEAGEEGVAAALRGEGDGEGARLPVRARLGGGTQGLAEELGAQADADDRRARRDAGGDQGLLRGGVEVPALLGGRGGALRPAHDHEQVDAGGGRRERVPLVETGAGEGVAPGAGPVLDGSGAFERLVDDGVYAHGCVPRYRWWRGGAGCTEVPVREWRAADPMGRQERAGRAGRRRPGRGRASCSSR